MGEGLGEEILGREVGSCLFFFLFGGIGRVFEGVLKGIFGIVEESRYLFVCWGVFMKKVFFRIFEIRRRELGRVGLSWVTGGFLEFGFSFLDSFSKECLFRIEGDLFLFFALVIR